MNYFQQRAVALRIAGGAGSTDVTPHTLGQQVEDAAAFHNDFTNSKVQSAPHWTMGLIPHETQLALSSTKTFPAQPSANKQ